MVEPAPISVIICAYSEDRLPHLARAIASVVEQDPTPSELILVIDHNASLEQQARRRWPTITVRASDGPVGLAGARNCGAALARSPIVAFLDDDATAASGWTASLLAAFAADDVHVVGGSAQPQWERGRPRWFPSEFDWVVGCTHSAMPVERQSSRNVVGCNMAFRRATLLAVGGFDSSVGRTATTLRGCEETECCIRVRHRFGERAVLYDPAITVDHAVPASRGHVRYFLRRCLDEGRSKARVAASVGSAAGLSDERRYVVRTLPRGVAAGLLARDARRSDGIARSLAMLVGLALTVTGYCIESALVAWSGRSPR
jgi:glucosyl-dolichyl phosphate glucuronosyltransferase